MSKPDLNIAMKSLREYIEVIEAEQAPAPAARRMVVPEHITNRYMRGKCFVLALALNRALKWPLYGMFLGDEMHHAFVRDPKTGMALDIRGLIPMSEVPSGSGADAESELRAVTKKEIMATVFSIDPADTREANKIVSTYFWWVGNAECSGRDASFMS
jgi:hypothetical protein